MECTPSDIRIVPHRWLLKTTSGKIARKANLEKYLETIRTDTLSADITMIPAASGNADPDMSKILCCINTLLTENNIPVTIDSPNQPLITSGIFDSLSLVSLILEIEKQFSITIPNSRLDLNYWNQPAAILNTVRSVGTHPQKSDTPPEKFPSIRSMKVRQFLNRTDGIDMLILGSSKSRELDPHIAEDYGYKAYNFWVKSSRVEDWYCIARFVADHNRQPLRHILIGIDIEAFSNAVNIDARLLQTPELTAYLAPSDLTTQPQINQSPDRERFRSVLLQYRLGLINKLNAYETIDPHYGHAERPDREPLYFKPPLKQTAENMLRLKGFGQLSPMRLKYFLKLVDLCRDHDIRLSCFLTPLHSLLHEHLTNHSAYIQRLDDLRRFMKTIHYDHFRFWDTCLTRNFGGIEDDFIDESHIGCVNSDILLRHLLNNLEFHIPLQQITRTMPESL
jgi:acyl carrier protein